MNYVPKTLLSVGADYKTVKGEKLGYLTGILYMSPNKYICPNATQGCFSACLVSAGRGVFSNVKRARQAKTRLFTDNLNMFMNILMKDIERLARKAAKKGLIPTIRLNGTSDIDYNNVKDSNGKTIFELFPEIQFYDYTPNIKRVLANNSTNYHLTYSVKEDKLSEDNGLTALFMGYNAAMVFDVLPDSYRGYRVINGDTSDLRFLDDSGVIVGLTAKGKAKKDTSGFVKRVTNNIKKVG